MPDVTVLASDLGHACFGLKAFGLCDYDPAKPFTVYFAPGAAIGALAFTLAVQQLLKPVHRFRLTTRHLTLSRIYICVFSGVAAAVVAAILPNITSLHGGPWGYPINWEILTTLLFAVAYGAVVVAIVRPVRAQAARLDDAFWDTAIETFHNGFPSIGAQPDGMTPFQQRLALKLIGKLSHNMKGFYPAVSRVLLACVGPYVHQAPQPNRTAFNILKEAVYFELKQFPQLAATKPDKIADKLPDNVTYDVATTDLVQTNRSGTKRVTKLSTLNLSPIDLVATNVRRT